MECGKLDLNNVALKAPKKKRNSKSRGFFTTFIFGNSVNKQLKNPKDLRVEYSRIMEEYNVQQTQGTGQINNR